MLVVQVVFRRNFFRAKLAFWFPVSCFALMAKGKVKRAKEKQKAQGQSRVKES
jgi:hypothetical protein